MSRKRTWRLTTATAGLALLAALSACGSGSDEPSGSDASSSSAPSESASASGGDSSAAEGLADPGEDLLDGATRGAVLKGTDQQLTWRFPESYDAKSAQQASVTEGGTTYEITIGSKVDTTAQAEGESVTEGMDGAKVEEVQVRDRPFVTTAADTDTGSLRAFFWTPEGATTTYAVLFYADGTSVADTPSERLDEVYQTVGSLAIDGETS